MRIAEKTSKILEEVAHKLYGEVVFDRLPPRWFFDVTCQGCVPLSFHIALSATSFENAIRLAVAHGGDSDTVGAIVGSMAESQYGVPELMKEKVKSYLPEEMLVVLSRSENIRS